MKFFYFFYIIIFLLFFSQCKKWDDFPDNPVLFTGTKILAHKGSGSYGVYQENTLDAAIYGFNNLDGIEIDIQKSRDQTIWLFHDEYFVECDGINKSRIPGKLDSELEAYVLCKGGGFQLSKLEEIFNYHRNNNLNKKISLDVKSWLPTGYSNTPQYLNELATMVVFLMSKYKMEEYVIVECENASFLNYIKKYSNVECYLTTFGDFDKGAKRALKAGYAGLSFRFDANAPLTKDQIAKLRMKGLKIQLWTINDMSEISKALLLEPDYIQTDNILLQ